MTKTPSKKYLAGAATHFGAIYSAVEFTSLASTAIPFTTLFLLNEAGKNNKEGNWIKTIIDAKVEADKTENWLENRNK